MAAQVNLVKLLLQMYEHAMGSDFTKKESEDPSFFSVEELEQRHKFWSENFLEMGDKKFQNGSSLNREAWQIYRPAFIQSIQPLYKKFNDRNELMKKLQQAKDSSDSEEVTKMEQMIEANKLAGKETLNQVMAIISRNPPPAVPLLPCCALL